MTGFVVGYHIPCLSLTNNILEVADIVGYYRRATSQGFQSYQPKAFIVGGNDTGISRAVKIRQSFVFYRPEKGNRVFYVKIPRQAL